jgi:hypothetical protein
VSVHGIEREATVVITLELYLDHQIIRGDLPIDEGQRPIDLLNSAKGGVVQLSDAWSVSLHAEAPPTRLDTVRVRRHAILAVVPRSKVQLPPRVMRTGFVEKHPLRIEVGIGPFAVAGSFYVTGHEAETLASLEHDPGGRFFVPLTHARLKSQYSPRWKVDGDLMFVNRGAITYSYLLPTL